ncbi:MAG: NAD(P)-dependent alcohol dehydrogenase [Armatimonadota bacterium]
MKAIVYEKYGPPEVLHLAEVAKPIPRDDQLLIRVHAVSINGADWENLVGKPLYARAGGLFKPGNRILGSDIAGRVEFAGKNNTEFKPGDEVYGELPLYHGGFAEYVCTSGKTMALKPASLTFEQAAAIPQAGVIALRGIRDNGRVQPGQKVLINGAGGSAGSFAVQLAKLYGAEVTGVDNAGKLDYIRSQGADHVIDYTREDYTKSRNQYDLILDLVAYRSMKAYLRALAPNGTFFLVGGSTALIFQILLMSPWIKRTTTKNLRIMAVPQDRKDLISITELVVAGKVVPVIDRVCSLSQVLEALRYVGEGRAKGKMVIVVANNNKT